MPQLANIVINDGAATPVAHTFAPVTTDGQLGQLAERSGLPIAYPKLAVSVRPPVNGGETYKIRLTLQVPQTSTVVATGKVVKDFTNTASLDLVFHERSTAQQRKDIRVLLANALANATVVTVVENLEPLY